MTNSTAHTAGRTEARIELPWKVYFQSPHAAVTRYRDGREMRTTSMHFATEVEALEFAGGDKRRVLYRPGEAWCRAAAKGGA